MKKYQLRGLFLTILLLNNLSVKGDEEVSYDQIKTVLDDSPFLSPRAGGMAGAISPVADGLNAPFYNPAGIGGLHWERQKPLFVRALPFPYIGGSVNENARELGKNMSVQDASQGAVLGKSVVAASNGKRQYARMFAESGVVFGRMTILHYEDTQFAAFDTSNGNDLGPDDPSINAAYRTSSGTGAGFSVTDTKEQIYLGLFTSYVSRSEFSGHFSYSDLITADERNQLLSKNNLNYQGISTNVGLIWVASKKLRPTFSIVSKDIGGTRYKLQNKSAHPEADSAMVQKSDLTLGFAISPRVGKSGAFNFVTEGKNLTNSSVSLDKKFRTAIELNLGGFGSEAIFGLRAGYNLAGVSGGMSLNLGLLSIELASLAEDIGIKNRHYPERRDQIVVMINVLDN